MKWPAIETRLRKMLRDPEGTLYTSDELMRHWNDAQAELQQNVRILEHVEAHRYPPLYDWVITHYWEDPRTAGDVYQWGTEWVGQNARVTYPWEPGYLNEDSLPPDDGTRWTHAWETLHCTSADYVPIPLHARFEKMKFIAWDYDEILPTTEKELSIQDRWYRSATGQVLNYWRPDNYHNQLVLYPHPGSPVIQTLPEPYDVLVAATGEAGVISSDDDELDRGDTGLAIDILDMDDALFVVYEPIPVPVEGLHSEVDWPDWMCRFVLYGVCERAFGADTDTFQPTLRDYWGMRKQLGVAALQRFKRGRLKDRQYIIGHDSWSRHSRSRLRMPQGYPASWP